MKDSIEQRAGRFRERRAPARKNAAIFRRKRAPILRHLLRALSRRAAPLRHREAQLNPPDDAVAGALVNPADREGFPAPEDWENAGPVIFSADWQGKNADPQRETRVRLLWTRETLFLQFRARYRELTVFPDAAANGRREHLWDRDVAEVFLQPDPRRPLRYTEFEVSPNGFWIDLDINLEPGEKRLRDLGSGLARRVRIEESQEMWTAELAIPMKALTAHFDPAAAWRVNFFRVEGPREPRFYSSWRPTRTPQPNFHVPEAFGRLLFAAPPSSPALP